MTVNASTAEELFEHIDNNPDGVPLYLCKTQPDGAPWRSTAVRIIGREKTLIRDDHGERERDALLINFPPGSPYLAPADRGEPEKVQKSLEETGSRTVYVHEGSSGWGDHSVMRLIPGEREVVTWNSDGQGTWRCHVDIAFPPQMWKTELKGDTAVITDLMAGEEHRVPSERFTQFPSQTMYVAGFADLNIDNSHIPDPSHPEAKQWWKAHKNALSNDPRAKPPPGQDSRKQIVSPTLLAREEPPEFHIKDREDLRMFVHRNLISLEVYRELLRHAHRVDNRLRENAHATREGKEPPYPQYEPPELDMAALVAQAPRNDQLHPDLMAVPTLIQLQARQDPLHAIRGLDLTPSTLFAEAEDFGTYQEEFNRTQKLAAQMNLRTEHVRYIGKPGPPK